MSDTVSTQKPRIIAIEGNIGAGKTTIFEELRKRFSGSEVAYKKVVFMPEPVDLWQTVADSSGETILSKYYADPKKYAFSFQVMAYTSRLSMLRKITQEHPDCDVVVCERSLEADRNIFAKMLYSMKNLEDVEYQVYEMLYKDTASDFPLDGAVYIDTDPEKCFTRIAKRSRMGESTIPLNYLQMCHDFYDEWLMRNNDTAFAMMHIDTNMDTTYEAGSIGELWVNQIVDFIRQSA